MQSSLYDRLGGKDAITAVVDDFVSACASDSRINAKFARTDIPRLKTMLVDQVCEAAGGPCTYAGRNMKGTHTGMGVTTGEFDASSAIWSQRSTASASRPRSNRSCSVCLGR
jgi:hemoglobin